MITFKTNRSKYAYLIATVYFILMMIYFFRNGFELSMIILYLIIFIPAYIIMIRDKINIFNEQMNIYSCLWIKRRTVEFTQIKYLKIEEYNKFPLRGAIKIIAFLDKNENILGYLPFHMYEASDISKIIDIIKMKNSKIKIDVDVEKMTSKNKQN